MIRQTAKQSLQAWEDLKASIRNATAIDHSETHAEQQARIKRLEADDEAWFEYYYPKYAYAKPAPFHKRATKRVMNNAEWYEVRAWSRELAKSARTMMEVSKMALTGKKKNVLLVSNSADNAQRLLDPYRANFESNQRLIHDYGIQEKMGAWEATEFTIRAGCSFRALGAGQSPRGTRNEAVRPDVILVDDIDTDEDCRNPEIIKKRWAWIEKALLGTRSISNPMLVIFCGNIIAPYCCITEAIQRADHTDVINIRDANGKSSWPEKNTEADIDRVLSKISYASQQQEYFNNPVREGTVFKEMAWKESRPLKEYQMLVCYTDPSFKDSKKNDFKGTVLVGKWRDEFHVIKAYLEQTSTAKMIEWHYAIMEQVGGQTCYYLMEKVFLSDILIKEFYEEGARRGKTIPLSGDERQKADKFTRIESLLELLNRNGKLYLNASEKDNPHMLRLEEQFKALAPGSRAHDDGPDAVEGAVYVLNAKCAALAAGGVEFVKRKPNSKRY